MGEKLYSVAVSKENHELLKALKERNGLETIREAVDLALSQSPILKGCNHD